LLVAGDLPLQSSDPGGIAFTISQSFDNFLILPLGSLEIVASTVIEVLTELHVWSC